MKLEFVNLHEIETAEVNPKDMAQFIYNFSTANPLLFNGKVIPVSISNP